MLTALSQLKAVLGITYMTTKSMCDPLCQRFEMEVAEGFVETIAISGLTSLLQLLFHLYSEVTLRQYQADRTLLETDPTALPSFSQSDAHPGEELAAELAHCMRLMVKCLCRCVEGHLPRILCDVEYFKVFFQSVVAAPLGLMADSWLPITRWRLERELQLSATATGNSMNNFSPSSPLTPGDQLEEFQKNPHFRFTKHVMKMAFKFCQEFVKPKETPKVSRAVATHYHEHYFPRVVESCLQLVRWHCAPPLLLTSKSYILALEILSLAVEHKSVYQSLLIPNAEEIMTVLLFPRLSFSKEEEELWVYNPEEYLLKQRNPVGDLYNPKIVSTSCLLSLAVPARKYHSRELLLSLVNFIMNQFQAYSAQAAEATADNADHHPAAAEAARRVDASLYCLYQFKSILQMMNFGDAHIEMVLLQFVTPATHYPLGFLRARSVLVLAEYAHRLAWSDASHYITVLQAVIPLLDDSELPVRVQVCECLSRLICHEFARETVTPMIGNIIQKYFELMRLMNNEGVVRTLRKTIRFYEATLSEWAVQLVQVLVQHFEILLENVTKQYHTMEQNADGAVESSKLLFSEDEDSFANLLLVSDEVLDTIRTVVRSLPVSTHSSLLEDGQINEGNFMTEPSQQVVESQDTFLQIQQVVNPMLFTILSYQGGSSFGFMDGALNLLTTLLARSPRVHHTTWRLLPCLHRLLQVSGTADYIAEMMAPIENCAGVDPLRFVLATFGELYGDTPAVLPAGDTYRQWTCYHCVLDMTETILKTNATPHNDNIPITQVASAVKIHDAVWLSYFSKTVLPFLQDGNQQSTPDVQSRLGSTVQSVLQQALTASTSPRLSANPTFLVLVSNVIFSTFLACTEGALLALHNQPSANATTMLRTFFQQYALLGAGDYVVGCLRSYDRALFVVTFARLAQWWSAHPDPSHPLSQEVQAVLTGITNQSELLTTFAYCDCEFYLNLQKELQKQYQRRQEQIQAGEDQEEYEDVTDEEEDFTDDDDDGGQHAGMFTGKIGNDDNDDDEDEDEECEEDEHGVDCHTLDNILTSAGGDAGKLQKMVRKAQKLRQDKDDDDDNDAGERDWEKEENLLEDTDFTSCLDTFNYWAYFLSTLRVMQENNNNSNNASAIYTSLLPHSELFSEAAQNLTNVLTLKEQMNLH